MARTKSGKGGVRHRYRYTPCGDRKKASEREREERETIEEKRERRKEKKRRGRKRAREQESKRKNDRREKREERREKREERRADGTGRVWTVVWLCGTVRDCTASRQHPTRWQWTHGTRCSSR